MSRRTRRQLTFAAAHLALIGLLFQIAALDHWRPSAIEQVRGVEHTQFHATHCHGASAGCADGAAAPYWAAGSPVVTPQPPPLRPALAQAATSSPDAAPPGEVLHPPREGKLNLHRI